MTSKQSNQTSFTALVPCFDLSRPPGEKGNVRIWRLQRILLEDRRVHACPQATAQRRRVLENQVRRLLV